MAGKHVIMSMPGLDSGTAVFEVNDNSTLNLRADFLAKGAKARNLQPLYARLAKQFQRQNRGVLRDFQVETSVGYDGSQVVIRLETGGQVGAFPLMSPISGRPDYGLIIKPRFGWQGIGPMLGTMGWKVLPQPLPLPLLPMSDRRIPPWVLASTILFRLQRLLNSLERRFEYTHADLRAPRGAVDWTRYAVDRLPRAEFLSVPCRYPDLRDDARLKGAIHFTLRKLLASLQSQRTSGTVVLQLIGMAQQLLQKVSDIPALKLPISFMGPATKSSFSTKIFHEGIEAIEWTVDDRGLAGLGDLRGLPWLLPMDTFFEGWLETIVAHLARSSGGIMKAGRLRQTIVPLGWSPPYLGSQRYLLPDVVLEREQETIIFDAKYKSHWEELNREGWHGLSKKVQEYHRSDLLQVLAYSTVSPNKRVVCCLCYPCQKDTWNSLLQRQRPFHTASVRAGARRVDLVLAAIPMGLEPAEITLTLMKAMGA